MTVEPNGEPVILIVEDNARNLKLVRDVLNHVGYRTLEAATAEDGLALAREERPGLVLTAFAMKDDRERFLAAGFDGYLEKPLDVRLLPEQVAAALAADEPTEG